MKVNSTNFKTSPLVGYGLCFLALVIGGLGLEKFATIESQLEGKVIAAQTELATLTAIKDTDHWAERLLKSTSARQQLQAEIWQGNTSGVIAAELQQALRALAQGHKFDNLQVRVDPVPIEVDGLVVLNFEFQGRSPNSKVIADYLESLAINPKLILIDEAYFSQNLQSPRPPILTMTGLIPVQIGQGATLK